MTAGADPAETPMVTNTPPDTEAAMEAINLWKEVATGLEKNQTVVWKSAVESLDTARTYLDSPDARHFVEKYMGQIVGILIEQVPAKIGPHERTCVQDSLTCAIQIVAQDLQIQVENKGMCSILSTLSHCLNKKKQFYKSSKGGAWSSSQMQGLPDFRLKVIEYFRSAGGFKAFAAYLGQTTGTPKAPSFDTLHHVLVAAGDASVSRVVENPRLAEEDVIIVSKAAMASIEKMSDDELKRLPTETLHSLLRDLQSIFDVLIGGYREITYEFYAFWRAVVLRMIKSPSLPVKLYGWEQVGDLVDAVGEQAPPPRAFIVSGAGVDLCNGRYEFGGEVTEDGYQKSGSETLYTRQIPDDPVYGDNAGKKLTLFRCTMRSQQKWWFLSHADEEQPGTDRDVDYYQHKSKEHEEEFPPPSGWVACRVAGADPPPTVRQDGLLVPEGQEYNSLEHQLAKWAIENEIVENVLGDTTIHREVVSRSTVLVNFLASMCTRGVPSMENGLERNEFCLKSSHLLFAWKTCTRKADSAVATEVYKLLVSILPRCPAELSVPLLEAVRSSLEQPESEGNLLDEVGEFSSLLASAGALETKVGATAVSSEVREAILNLLWALLSCPEVSRLKSHDDIKKYVTIELQKDVKGEHRGRFLQSCLTIMLSNVDKLETGSIDEDLALRVVTLTNFVLHAFPKAQANKIVLKDNGSLPELLFSELIAYLDRRRAGNGTFRKSSNGQGVQVDASEDQHKFALRERLSILRYVYGLSGPVDESQNDSSLLTVDMVRCLWGLCDAPPDRELAMIFLASASNTTAYNAGKIGNGAQGPASMEIAQAAVFTHEVGMTVFIDLFCSTRFRYDHMGDEAYKSFQTLFTKLYGLPNAPTSSKEIALDAVWRVCLTALSDSVVSRAMRDLLRVYAADAAQRSQHRTSSAPVQGTDEGFGERILQYLVRVKGDIDAKAPFAKRSVQRCLRILNAAVGRSETDGYSLTSSTLSRVSQLPLMAGYSNAIKCIPHGMQGQACYRQIGVTVKRTQVQNIPTTQNYQDSQGQRPSSPLTKLSFLVHPLETLASIKTRVASKCQCKLSSVRPVQINGRATRATPPSSATDPAQLSISVAPEDSVMDELGVVEGCEMVFVVAERPTQGNIPSSASPTNRSYSAADLTSVFFSDNHEFGDKLFDVLLSILDSLQGVNDGIADVDQGVKLDPNRLVWDLLLAMPTNASVINRLRSMSNSETQTTADDAMDLDSTDDSWSQLVDTSDSNRAVYSLLTIDSILEAAPEVFSVLPEERQSILIKEMIDQSKSFRQTFLESGGLQAVVESFSSSQLPRRGNAAALRILKSCIFGPVDDNPSTRNEESNAQSNLLQSLTNTNGLLQSLTAMVVADKGISSTTIMDVLRFLRLLFNDVDVAKRFVSLGEGMAESFVVTLLWRDDDQSAIRSSAMANSAMVVRRSVHDLILETPVLCDAAFSWLVDAVHRIDVSWENASEHFDALRKLIENDGTAARSQRPTESELQRLGLIVCKKIASCPKPTSESELGDIFTGVLCGCLKLLSALVLHGGGLVLKPAVALLQTSLGTARWSQGLSSEVQISPDDGVLVDLMGVIFDGLLSPQESSSVAMCFDKESRQHGFNVIHSAAQSRSALLVLVAKINTLISAAAPNLRNRFGEFGAETSPRSRNTASKYSGLRNQGCTCYMNSVLQQLFMMPELKDSMCAAPLPTSLRSIGGSVTSQGKDLIGKKISLQWDNGVSYDAMVESFDDKTGMHTIRYCAVVIASVGGSHQQVHPEDIESLPEVIPDEFVLAQGRPGRETGAFEIVPGPSEESLGATELSRTVTKGSQIEESADEKSSRHLLEQFQRTLIHLEKGSRGRCFDPRALVEACACLKLEFDVWQQNDASEFATKLLDRLEISLKKWAPDHFHYMDHTFGLKQTKQKICKNCGMKSNREEKLLNIDCQIRGNNDIHEALAAMTEVELMEGSNKVFCDQCNENTDTVLRTAISTLPNMLILSLKRFDLDFNTFETVKLNSRCSFGQTLNMKPYTLAGMEEAESESMDESERGASPMDTGEPGSRDVDFEYRLAGVLVHAGVAQGGHYYSFIKDRSDNKWYRFDDEDVTPFDQSSIETECFGGKVKKETKWPNGQVHSVEQEQYANALMLFYEKVSPSDPPEPDKSKGEEDEAETQAVPMLDVKDVATGYDAYEPDVHKSNARHRWQSFLFDREFHEFLKGMLQLCQPNAESPLMSTSPTWKPAVVDMTFCFVFDVLLYSSDRSGLNGWTQLLEIVLNEDKQVAKGFVDRVANKCHRVTDNWMRTYLLECPDLTARTVAVRVFTAAFRSCVELDSEFALLDRWTAAWDALMENHDTIQRKADKALPVPCQLVDQWAKHEDSNSSDYSSLGCALSFLNILMDALPRCSRFHVETASFIRNLASISFEDKGAPFRRALVAAQSPARLVVLIARERVYPIIRDSFPALSISIDAAQTQIRPESSSSMMNINSSHGLSSADMGGSRSPSTTDYVVIIEAVLCIVGLPGVVQAPVVRDADDMPRGRHRFALSEGAANALNTIFVESSSNGAPGMGHAEIEVYLKKCSPENGVISNQKINEMMAKYPTTKGNHDPRGDYLSLEGFLAYYRDSVQTNDLKLRLDLHTCGFRPDLTRRSHASRFVTTNNRDTDRRPAESVAIDVADTFGDGSIDCIGELGRMALSQTYHLFGACYTMSEPLSHYLVSAVTYNQKTESLINNALQSIYRTPNDWNGNEMITQATNTLAVVCSTPGDDLDLRIAKAMASTVKPARNVEHGAGLLNVLRACYRARQGNQYNDDLHWKFERYIGIVKELRQTYPVFVWMNNHLDQWSFIEQEIMHDNRRAQQQQHHVPQIRHDYTSRRQQHEHYNDSDMGYNESEDEDDSLSGSPYSRSNNPHHNPHHHHQQYQSQQQQPPVNDGPAQIIVRNAGNDCVNGVYYQNGYFDRACRYMMEGTWRNSPQHFSIFQCNVSNNTKHWYISIVPYDGVPGTASDIDFYTAPAIGEHMHLPPETGWVKSQEGEDDAPQLEFRWNNNTTNNNNGNSSGNENNSGGGGGPRSGHPTHEEDEEEDLRWNDDEEEDSEHYNNVGTSVL